MEKLEVRIVKLEPMRVICFNGFGPHPEHLAWEKLKAWAKNKGLWTDGQPHRFFGYNHPNPSPASPNYGYDVWMTVDDSIQAEGEARIIQVEGGLYAVTRCEAGPQGEDIYQTWQKLIAWVENSPYRNSNMRRQWLEEHLSLLNPPADGSFVLDLMDPVVE